MDQPLNYAPGSDPRYVTPQGRGRDEAIEYARRIIAGSTAGAIPDVLNLARQYLRAVGISEVM
jgi:hypothetical protein